MSRYRYFGSNLDLPSVQILIQEGKMTDRKKTQKDLPGGTHFTPREAKIPALPK